MLIGGEWLQTETRLPVNDPATFTVLAEIGDASVSDGLDAVAAAHDAFQTWSVTPARQLRRGVDERFGHRGKIGFFGDALPFAAVVQDEGSETAATFGSWRGPQLGKPGSHVRTFESLR